MKFSDLLHLDVACDVITSASAAVLVVGDARDIVAIPKRARESDTVAHVLLGLAIHTSPVPVLMHSVITERGATLAQASLFGWIEDNFMDQPRADVIGLLPTGEQPLLFVRDLDLDRPPEAYVLAQSGWRRVVGVLIANRDAPAGARVLDGDLGALAALDTVAPDARPFVDALRADVGRGLSLRASLRQRRKTADARLASACDGWRVLARAARVLVVDPLDPHPADLAGLLPG